jgi:TonB-dependent starch-binding outer membrane protein SusC
MKITKIKSATLLLSGYLIRSRIVQLAAFIVIMVMAGTLQGTNLELFQPRTVTGKVTSSDFPGGIPGVNVFIKGTTRGTVTDQDGDYAIDVPTPETVLVYSFIGYLRKEEIVGNRSVVNVVLEQQMTALDEFVVIGYGTAQRSDLTGAVTSIRAEDFNAGVHSSMEQLFLGRSPGVQVNQNSSEPGGGISVRIRGVTSANAGSEPLWVIDGLPVDNAPLLQGGGAAGVGGGQTRNPLSSINPNDIQSIEILKDASATAIYGARGANGVILITTKRGQVGQWGVNYNGSTGVQSVVNRMDLLNTHDYMTVINELSIAEGRSAVFTDEHFSTITGTDWQDVILRNAIVQDHNVSASGGNDVTTFFGSLNYFNQDGVIKETGIQRYTGRINLEQKIGQRTKLGINLNTSAVYDNNSLDNNQDNEGAGPLYSALLYDPTESIFDENGNYTRSAHLTVQNPMRLVDGISSQNQTNRTFGTVFATYNITDDLQSKINFGSDRISTRRDIYNSRLTFFGVSAGGLANIATLERSNTLLEYTMSYNRIFSENHRINSVGGVTYQHFTSRFFAGNIGGFPADDLGTNNLGLGDTDTDNLSSGRQEHKLLSYLGRINYSAFNRFLLTASFRIDGSSKFGPNHRYGYFPSFAAAYRLSEENFMPEIFDDFKFRASWGRIGNEAIGNYEYISTLGPGNEFAVIDNGIIRGLRPTRVANPELRWETTEQIDLGVDVTLLRGRISATFDYFIKDTWDMLYNLPMPQSSGFGSMRANIGSMRNTGVEFMMSSVNVTNQNFTWSTSFNIASIRNRVTSLGGLNDLVGFFSIIREGEPLHSYYGYKVIGFDAESPAQPNARPGEPIFEDVNGDGVINAQDLQILGKPFPDFTFGFQNTLRYRSFQFDFFIQGMQGASLINQNLIESLYPKNFRRNRIAETVLDRWTPENPDARWPSSVNAQDYAGNRMFNSFTVQDASYIRLRNVQLSYNIPTARLGAIRSASVYITGQNLYTITNYIGFDPEASATGQSAARMDISSYPLARTWIMGINLGL